MFPPSLPREAATLWSACICESEHDNMSAVESKFRYDDKFEEQAVRLGGVRVKAVAICVQPVVKCEGGSVEFWTRFGGGAVRRNES